MEKSSHITESELRNMRANTYIMSNGIRRQREQVKKLNIGMLVQTLCLLVLTVCFFIQYKQLHTAQTRLESTQVQLREESGQAASFREWYNNHQEVQNESR